MKSFTITAASKEVKLDGKGSGNVAITVANTNEKTVRGTPQLNPIGLTSKDWLSLAGGTATRSFDSKENKQFVVEIKVPLTAKPGEYSFGLNISNEAIPDDDCAVGPAVMFRFEAATVPAAKKQIPWWIMIVLGVVLVGGGVTIAILLSGSKSTVPPLVGKSLSDASNLVAEAHLQLEVTAMLPTGTNQLGTVISQDHTAGKKVAKDTVVKLAVEAERDKVAVPKLIGLPVGKVKEIYGNLPLVYVENDKLYCSTNVHGHVVKQVPGHSTLVEPGTNVLMTVADDGVKVPDLVKTRQLRSEDAQEIIKLSKLKVGTIHKIGPTPQNTWGMVLAQAPKAGTNVPPGSPVNLFVGGPGQAQAIGPKVGPKVITIDKNK